jgi:hypothetical protein
MSHETPIGRVWVFDSSALEQALEDYQAAAEAAYPRQRERIGIAVAAIRDFLYSECADPLTLRNPPR